MQKWQCRVAPSLGEGFAGDVYSAWGVKFYENDTDPTVFFGIYGLPDFYALWRHKGRKAILWAGSDIRHLYKGYWLDEVGKIRIDPNALVDWIAENCESYCENETEKDLLWQMCIRPKAIIPSFLGNVADYSIQELRTDQKRYYTSVSGDDFELYGWHEIDGIAKSNPNTEYHLYGNTKEWITTEKNVIIHGRISQAEMNEQIKSMTGALRLTKFDGASEILVKSTLWGQKPLSPYIHYDWLGDREKLLLTLNTYPWVSN